MIIPCVVGKIIFLNRLLGKELEELHNIISTIGAYFEILEFYNEGIQIKFWILQIKRNIEQFS